MEESPLSHFVSLSLSSLGRKAISQLTVRNLTLRYVVMAAGHSGDGPDGKTNEEEEEEKHSLLFSDASREALVRNQKWTLREDYSGTRERERERERREREERERGERERGRDSDRETQKR
jgi:hypothetical protein